MWANLASCVYFFSVKLFFSTMIYGLVFNKYISANMTSCVCFLGLSQPSGGNPVQCIFPEIYSYHRQKVLGILEQIHSFITFISSFS